MESAVREPGRAAAMSRSGTSVNYFRSHSQSLLVESNQTNQRKISSSSNHSLQHQPIFSLVPASRSASIPSIVGSAHSSISNLANNEICCILTPLQRVQAPDSPAMQPHFLLPRVPSTKADQTRIRKKSYRNENPIVQETEEITEDGSKMVVRLVFPQSSYASLDANEEERRPQPPPSSQSPSLTSRTTSTTETRTPSNLNFDGPFLLAGALDDTKTYPSHANQPSRDSSRNGSLQADVKLGQGNVLRHRRSLTSVSAPQATPENEKKDAFRGKLTVILSTIYAVFLVTVGLVIGVADLIMMDSSVGEVFSLYLILVGLTWFLFLHMDVRRNSRRMLGYNTHGEKDAAFASKGWRRSADDPYNLPPYMYSHSRHSGSFFLKIGAAGFCFGHLIHSTLLMSRQVLHFMSDDEDVRRACADQTALIESILHPIYSFYQLFMLFKYSSVIINRCKELARFAIMHCLATSLYYWFSMILRETLDSLQHKLLDKMLNATSVTTEDETRAYTEPLKNAVPFLSTFKAAEGSGTFIAKWNISISIFTLDICHKESEFSHLLLDISPYLYPFSIEYSILVVGMWYILWQNIGKVEEYWKESVSHSYDNHDQEQPTTSSLKDAFSNTLVIHADCHSANRGLFAGLLVMVATVVTIILFFIACAHKEYVATGILVNLLSETTLLILMTGSVLFAYRQISQLDVNHHPISLLDDLLLFLCIPCFFLYGIFSIVPSIAYEDYLTIAIILLQVVQVIIQTPFIIDGLRRCSNTTHPRSAKPGRELVTFLIICNLAMWIIETFEIKSYETNYERIEFYGYPLWAFLSHVSLPLTLFYRFHSSVCLVDIWKSAYEPGE